MGFLDGKTLDDLTPASKSSGKSNLLSLTDAEKWSIVLLLKAGKGLKEIKKTVRRDVDGAKLGFSFAQIKSVETEWQAKIVELTSEEGL